MEVEVYKGTFNELTTVEVYPMYVGLLPLSFFKYMLGTTYSTLCAVDSVMERYN